MKTEFDYVDLEGNVRKADLILGLVENNKNYVVFTLEDEPNDQYDLFHFGAYTEEDGKPIIDDITDDELGVLRKRIYDIVNS